MKVTTRSHHSQAAIRSSQLVDNYLEQEANLGTDFWQFLSAIFIEKSARSIEPDDVFWLPKLLNQKVQLLEILKLRIRSQFIAMRGSSLCENHSQICFNLFPSIDHHKVRYFFVRAITKALKAAALTCCVRTSHCCSWTLYRCCCHDGTSPLLNTAVHASYQNTLYTPQSFWEPHSLQAESHMWFTDDGLTKKEKQRFKCRSVAEFQEQR